VHLLYDGDWFLLSILGWRFLGRLRLTFCWLLYSVLDRLRIFFLNFLERDYSFDLAVNHVI